MYLEKVPKNSIYRHIAEEAVEHIGMIPAHMRDGVLKWVFYGVSGEFLKAVVNNDLFEACGKADRLNSISLSSYAQYFYNYAPSGCSGSAAEAAVWADQGGILGILSKRFRVVAFLPGGQRFSDEAHVGEYYEGGMTRREADEAVYNLENERPIGHEDVVYEVEEEA